MGELLAKWRVVAAASLGQATGYLLVTYVSNLFSPHLLHEFGWSRAAFALMGVTLVLGVVIQPITGRLGDRFGVRRVAVVGVIGGPITLIGFSRMSGQLWQFFLLTLMFVVLTSGTTSVVNYSRLAAQQFERSRGIALAISASAPAALAAGFIPLLSRFIDASGWRAGYLAVAAVSAIGGATALILIPPAADAQRIVKGRRREASFKYGALLRSRPFQLLFGAAFLSMLAYTFETTQLKLVLLDHKVDSGTGTLALSVFAAATIGGRLLCGMALDRIPAYGVAAGFLGLSGVGLSLIAGGVTQPLLLAAAVATLGLTLGAEGDVWAYLVTAYFKAEVYGTVLGFVFSGMAASAGVGALLLSASLKLWGFTPFLALTAFLVFVSSGFLIMLSREPHSVSRSANFSADVQDPIS